MLCDVRWKYVPLLLPIRNANEKPKKHYEHLMLKSEDFCSIRGVCMFLSFLFFWPSATSESSSSPIVCDRNEANSCCCFPLSRKKHRHTRAHYPIHRVVCLPKVTGAASAAAAVAVVGWLAGCHPSFSIKCLFSSYTILINKILFLI